MKMVTNFPLFNGCLDEYGSMEGLLECCRECGVDGIEAIWDCAPYTDQLPLPSMAIGHHLVFWSCWVDFWIHDEEALMREYPDWDTVYEYYRGKSKDSIVEEYGRDIERAMQNGAEYLVFHVSEVNLEECFTYSFVHSDDLVIDCALECINRITPYITNGAALLVENQWWPGFTFTRPEITKRLLDGIEYDNKGIMLDIGHLMNANTGLRTEQDGIAYINQMLDEHGELAKMVRGLHLHQSLSGEYVESNGYRFTQKFLDSPTYWEKYASCYDHILHVDLHQPWTDPGIAQVVQRIDPEWVNHELSAYGKGPHSQALKTQIETLRRGGLSW